MGEVKEMPGKAVAVPFKDAFPSQYWELEGYKRKIDEIEQVKEENRWIASVIASFFIIAFITFGWQMNHSDTCYDWQGRDGKMYRSCDAVSQGGVAIMSGIFWPVYWAGKVALLVTKWP